ncbi:MAG: YhbY family RNA-binding protein [Aerococcus sp.]|nr:YhbY family RNA-binding protein [Aerococcus sp.]
MNNKQKKLLKQAAQRQKALFQLGKANLTPEFITQIDEALNKRELVKISILQNATQPDEEVEEALISALGLEWSDHIGHTLSLFRTAKQEKNRDLSLRVKALGMV